MITNDYIKGYLAELRTVQDALGAIQKSALENEETTEDFFEGQITTHDAVLNLVLDLRNAYKIVVDQLNKESSEKT